MKEYKDFVPDITKIQKCKINKIKTSYNFDSYEYLNEKNMVIKRDEVYYEEDKEIMLSTKIYKYEHDDFYCKEAEGGIAWNDPKLNIDWGIPKDDIILSEKDKHPESFEEFNKHNLF